MAEHEEPGGEVSRRAMLGGAGAAVLGGVIGGVAASAGGVAFATTPPSIARGIANTTMVEFRDRTSYTGTSGQSFTSVGFLTKIAGAKDSDLFAGTTRDVAHALFTTYATGTRSSRVLDQSVHLLHLTGTLTVHQRSTPGANFSSPASFQQGPAVAKYSLSIQQVLTVFSTATAVLQLTCDMQQTSSAVMSGGLAGKQFGLVGDRLREHGTGLATLVDSVTYNWNLETAGNWAAVDPSSRS